MTGSSDQSTQFYGRKPSQQTNQTHNGLSRGNIATVEPYNHVPLPNSHQIKMHHTGNQEVYMLQLKKIKQTKLCFCCRTQHIIQYINKIFISLTQKVILTNRMLKNNQMSKIIRYRIISEFERRKTMF